MAFALHVTNWAGAKGKTYSHCTSSVERKNAVLSNERREREEEICALAFDVSFCIVLEQAEMIIR